MTTANVLFVCSDNAFYSPIAEAYLNQVAPEFIRAFSAGPMPGGELSSLARKTIFKSGLSEEGLEPKSWTMFALPHAPQPDFVILLEDEQILQPIPKWADAPTVLAWAGSLDLARPKTMKDAEAAFEGIKKAIDEALLSRTFVAKDEELRAVG